MKVKQTLADLKKAGTEETRQVFGRHGVSGDVYGVSHAEHKKLARAAGTNHKLAIGLWASGNHDARILACMVCDPTRFTSRELDAMARDLDNYLLTDAFSGVVIRSGQAMKKFEAWKNRKSEFTSAAAWNILANQAFYDETLTDDFCAAQIAVIEAEIHSRPNRTRHSMNQALISLGVRNAKLEKQARAAAKKIGKVIVDHGQTNCRTPDAVVYIDKTLEHRAKKAAEK